MTRDRLLALAARLGIAVEDVAVDDSSRNAWDGRAIALRGWHGEARSDSDLAHEIAHWIVAAPSRRRLRDFGLGAGPDGGPPAPQPLSVEGSQREEERASLLGCAIEHAIGGTPLETLRAHSWTGAGSWGDLDSFWRTVAWLYRRGLVDERGRYPGARP